MVEVKYQLLMQMTLELDSILVSVLIVVEHRQTIRRMVTPRSKLMEPLVGLSKLDKVVNKAQMATVVLLS